MEAYPLQATDSETLANVFVKEIVCRYGVPTVLHSDQGANLTSSLITNMCNILGINRTRTTAYHPQGNGRFNRTLKTMLSTVVAENQADWDTHLPILLMAYRTAIHGNTGFTPFHILFGRSPKLPVDTILQGPAEDEPGSYPHYITDLKKVHHTFRQVRESSTQAHVKQKMQYDKKTHEFHLRIGELVYLHTPAVKQGLSRKLCSPWTGPYTIVDRISRYNVRIQLVGGRKNLVVHINRLKPYKGVPYEAAGVQSQSPPTDTMTVTEKTSGYVSLDEEDVEVEDEGTIGTSVAQGPD